jgi:hypothetical protein
MPFGFGCCKRALYRSRAFALFQDRKRGRRGGALAQTKRGAESMRYFLVVCLIIGLPVAICASVDVPLVSGHHVLWILVDAAVVGYVCLRNRWFHNDVLLPFIQYLSGVENR